MPFATADYNRVRRFLNVDSAWKRFIETHMNWAGQDEAIVAEVQNDLYEIEDLEVKIAAQAAKDGLKKADVLEWQNSGHTSGLRRRRSELIRRVANACDLTRLLDGDITPDQIARS